MTQEPRASEPHTKSSMFFQIFATQHSLLLFLLACQLLVSPILSKLLHQTFSILLSLLLRLSCFWWLLLDLDLNFWALNFWAFRSSSSFFRVHRLSSERREEKEEKEEKERKKKAQQTLFFLCLFV
jgi:hypothetical protein